MPSLLFETFLRFLYEELLGVLPDKISQWAFYIDAAGGMQQKREQIISPATSQLLLADFNQKADRFWLNRLGNIGLLVISAVADERQGISHASSTLMSWLGDSTRFSESWCLAVRELNTKTRGLAGLR